MRKNDVFPSKYWRPGDLSTPAVVTIKSAPYENLKTPDGKAQGKTVLYFHETSKALPLNLTNWDSVAEIAGEDTDDWSGKQIELYGDETQVGAATKPCIRIRKPDQGQLPLATETRRPIAKPPHDDMDDAIPDFR